MILNHLWGLYAHPKEEWQTIDARHESLRYSLIHILLVALIPSVCAYFSAVHIGWSIGVGEPISLTAESALMLAVAMYIALILGVFALAYLAHWMAHTFGSEPTYTQTLELASYTSTPLFMVGIAALYPELWFVMLVGLAGSGHCIAMCGGIATGLAATSPKPGLGTAFALTAAGGHQFLAYAGVPSMFALHAVLLLVAAVLAWVALPLDQPPPASAAHGAGLLARHVRTYTDWRTALPGLCFFCYTGLAVALLTTEPVGPKTICLATWLVLLLQSANTATNPIPANKASGSGTNR